MKQNVPYDTDDVGISRERSDDLEELRWHIEQLQQRLAAQTLSSGSAAISFRAAVHSQLLALQDAIVQSTAQPTGELLAAHQDRIRALYRSIAAWQTATPWHSSPGSLSHPIVELSALSHLGGFNDYERGFLPWLEAHERHLRAVSQPNLPGRALLFSSGMGAIQTALQSVLSRCPRVLLGKRVYYETQSLLSLSGVLDRLSPLDENKFRLDALVEAIRRTDAIFVDTITLDPLALRTDFTVLYRAIQSSGRTGIELIVDNTVPGPECQIPTPPPGVRLFIVESLLKNYQAGLDLVASGMLVVVTSPDNAPEETLVHNLEVLRSTNGTNLCASSARAPCLCCRARGYYADCIAKPEIVKVSSTRFATDAMSIPSVTPVFSSSLTRRPPRWSGSWNTLPWREGSGYFGGRALGSTTLA